MIGLGTAIAIVVVVDAAWRLPERWARIGAAAIVGAGVLVLAGAVAQVPVTAVVSAALAGAAWLLVLRVSDGAARPGAVAALVALAIPLVASLVLALDARPPVEAVERWVAWLVAVAAALAASTPANRVVRLILRHAGVRMSDGGESVEFRGGRMIGPLERILIGTGVVLGEVGLVAAIMAAKGIVRYPEISGKRKRDQRNAAEEFLVGSLVSWLVAIGLGIIVRTALGDPTA